MIDTRSRAAEAARAARAQLGESLSRTRAELMPQALAERAQRQVRHKASHAIQTTTTRIAKNKLPLLGTAAGICLLLLAKPLLNTLKSKSETKNDQ